MQSNLSSCQLQVDFYNYKMFHISLMITKNKKPVVDTQKRKRKESKYITTKKSSIEKGRQQERKKETTELQNSQKQINKMAIVSPYL